MKAVITVIGHDQIGIVAKVSQRLATLKVNITDISQTLMHGDFTMMLMGEWNDAPVAIINRDFHDDAHGRMER